MRRAGATAHRIGTDDDLAGSLIAWCAGSKRRRR